MIGCLKKLLFLHYVYEKLDVYQNDLKAYGKKCFVFGSFTNIGIDIFFFPFRICQYDRTGVNTVVIFVARLHNVICDIILYSYIKRTYF